MVKHLHDSNQICDGGRANATRLHANYLVMLDVYCVMNFVMILMVGMAVDLYLIKFSLKMNFDYLNCFRPMMMVNHSYSMMLMQFFAVHRKNRGNKKNYEMLVFVNSSSMQFHSHSQSNYQAPMNAPFFHWMTIVWIVVEINLFDRVTLWFALLQFAGM